MADKITFTMSQNKETKNTKRFGEDGDQDKPINLYLRNEQLKKIGDPDEIRVTVTAK